MSENNNLRELEARIERVENKLITPSVFQFPVHNLSSDNSNDEIELGELLRIVWRGKWLVAALTFLITGIAIIYAYSLPNIYKSEALLASVEDGSGNNLAGLAGQFGGLASLAGVNLGSNKSDKTKLAIEVIKSREFIAYFIEKHNILVPLMASVGWDIDSDTLKNDGTIYDEDEKKWVRNVSPPMTAAPSMQEAYREFYERLVVMQDKKSGFITLSFEFYSPFLAKQWVDWLVEDINEVIKMREVEEAHRSIQYLNTELGKTSITQMQSIFFELIEEQTKIIMFAEVRREYVFETIDKAIVSELRERPKKVVIAVIGFVLGLLFGVLFVVIKSFVKSNQSNGNNSDRQE